MRSGAWSEPSAPTATSAAWRVSPGFAALKCAVTVVLVGVAVFLAGDPRALTAAIVAAVVAGGYALRDLLVPVRLAADPHGVTVINSYAGRRRLDWGQIERIRVDSRTRAGLRTELLEIDTGDHLHLLSTYDLNAHPGDVADELQRIRGLA
ncbi:hypothetical protein GCM10010399_42930 [Dactylosporangium fulvum]|uniref:PH domain-containing protein n=1 Tax=Dactylosporangium fulvum TaxID=53359 RepID=A0ABY5WDH1_9ACTN|nr:PH domain-containing protein [Dactylosporangium fulvum]UWP87269.1 PH domain-containing protein [Dactylosporangium fulvum]